MTAPEPLPSASASLGPFASHALRLWASDVCPIPCGGDDGKQPLVKWHNIKRRLSRETIRSWSADRRFEDANLGVLTGVSNLTVVDIDNAQQIDQAIKRFGHTPIVVATPSGGLHLYYRSRGERCQNLRPFGLEIDIKGIGGFVVAPPSRRVGVDGQTRHYSFLAGEWTDIEKLPPILPDALEFTCSSKSLRHGRKKAALRHSSPIEEGRRNDSLFRSALRISTGCDNEIELVDEVLALNGIQCEPPLPENEVRRIAESAWRYEEAGKNFTSSGGFSCSYQLIDRIGDSAAFWLYQHLMRAHFQKVSTHATFAVSPRAMASAKSLSAMGETALRRARDHLVAIGVLVKVSPGGRSRHDPALFTFGKLDAAAAL
jgi:Bifunctional DNA primase/polymerase, N-terminal/Primase C terminal 1 (PriCT-1)